MREAFLIARREYLERVRTRAFLLTTLLTPLLMLIIMGGSLLASVNAGAGGQHIVIASSNPQLAHAVAQALATQQKHPPVTEVQSPASPQTRQALIQAVSAKHLDGALWLGENSSSGALEPEYLSRSATDMLTTGQMERAVNSALTRERLRRQGVPPGEIEASLKSVDITTLRVKDGHASASSSVGSFLSAYVLVMLLYFTVIFYCMNVARSVIDEKTSRIFEVLLSATTPESLMAGKILGVGAAGLTQIGIWVAAAFLLTGSSMALHNGFSGTGLAALGITTTQIVLLVVFFLLGFLFYSAVSAALGSSVSTEQEVQQFSIFISLPLLLCLVSMGYVLSNPNTPVVVALSLVPPLTPMLMYLRVAAQQPPWWQIGLSVLLMALSIWAMLWIASRIYRVGILMYGKRATLPEMLRWLRYS